MPNSPTSYPTSHSRSASQNTSNAAPSSFSNLPHPTFIEIPPPPSGTVTPSDMGPSTPNSTTTSLSAISTIAMKDGHRGGVAAATRRGFLHYGMTSSSASEAVNAAAGAATRIDANTSIDALRADRISRLAGLERVGVAGGSGSSSSSTAGRQGSGATSASIYQGYMPTPYPAAVGGNTTGGFTHFDPWTTTASMQKERSTVGIASATGSIGGRTTTWMSASQDGDSVSISDNDVDVDGPMEMDDSSMPIPGAVGITDPGSANMRMAIPTDPETANALPAGGVWDGKVSMLGSVTASEDRTAEDDDDFDDGQASLVGFGEGANSTVSGPISTLGRANHPMSPVMSNFSASVAGNRNSQGPPPPVRAGSTTSLPMHPAAHSQAQTQVPTQGLAQTQTQGQSHRSPASQSNSSNTSNLLSENAAGALSPSGNTAAAPGAIPLSPLSSASNVVTEHEQD
ncbi:hypothetical protein KEM54_001318 [Ascosphaera aggregata]|nr:hypothetical protein KEM54_001318 [Ascosphaera aggregata]